MSDLESPKSWQIPPVETTPEYRVGWLNELVQNGDNWCQAQPGIRNIRQDIQLLMGMGQDRDLESNLLQPDIRTFVETITDLRQIATMGSKADQFKKTVALYNDIFKFIFWDSQFVPMSRKALQWAVLGRGYKWQKFSRDKFGWGRSKIVFDPLGPREFLPEQLPSNNDVQGCYAGTIVRPMGIAEAHARFPQFQQWLIPISRYDWKTYGTLGMARRYDFYDRFRFTGDNKEAAWESKYCVPLDSEILTRSGWKKHYEVAVGDEVMGYNNQTQKCEWTALHDITIKKNQDVYTYGSKQFTVRCTDDHRWIVKKRATPKERKEKDIFYNRHSEFSTIDDCATSAILVQAAPGPDGPGIQNMEPCEYLMKDIAVARVLQMTSGERGAFIMAMLYGEGHRHKGKKSHRGTTLFAQLPGPVYDATKLACALEGIATSQSYYASEKTSETRVFSLRHNAYRKIDFKKTKTSVEDVWCPTTGLGTWVMRQNDNITITGNCEIRYTFVRDLRINRSGYMKQMGVDGASWGYQVPSVGDLIVTTNPFNGYPQSRKAEVGDCRLYPQLRLVITSPSCPYPLYDDTSFDWHGEIPVTQHDVNDWVWSAAGYSLVGGVKGLEIARRDRLSDINSVLAVRKDPPLGHDVSTGVQRTQMDKLDLLHAQGIRVGGKGNPAEWTRSLLPESMIVEEADFKGVDLLDGAIKASLGLTDLASMREIKGNMSDDSMEKFLENLGPVGKGIALNQWVANAKDANMLKYNIAQYYTTQDLMQMVGPEGVGLETFDNDPNSLIPSHINGEDKNSDSAHTKQDRAKWFLEQLKVVNTPAQLLNITHQQERMLNMFFLQKGVPISTASVMEKIGVDDYETQHEAWKQEQLEDAMWKLDVQKAVSDKINELGLQPPGQEPGPGQGAGGGRPSTGATPPHAEEKGSQSGNVRVVNSTSK